MYREYNLISLYRNPSTYHLKVSNMKSFFALSFGVLAVVGLMFFNQTTEATETLDGVQVGDKAPEFKLKDVSGEMFSFDSYPDAKGFIVTFTCNHCPFAVMYEDRLIELHNTYADRGYPVIAINPNDPDVQPEDSFEKMQERAKEKGFPFVYLFDEAQDVYPEYGAERTPHVFLVDNERVVRYIGAIDDNARDASSVSERYVENAIMALEKGTDPDPDFTRAIGCSIKTK